MNVRLGPPTASQNPFLQGLYLLLGAALLVGAIVVGAFLLALAIGVGVVLAAIVYGRVWWIRRKLARTAGGRGTSSVSDSDGRVIEADYSVMDEESGENRDRG